MIRDHAPEFGHVQIADAPGRGQPGSGELPIQQWIRDAEAGGYTGWVGLEYKTADRRPVRLAPPRPARHLLNI